MKNNTTEKSTTHLFLAKKEKGIIFLFEGKTNIGTIANHRVYFTTGVSLSAYDMAELSELVRLVS